MKKNIYTILILLLISISAFSQNEITAEVNIQLNKDKPSIQSFIDAGIHAKNVAGLEDYLCRVKEVDINFSLPNNKTIKFLAKAGEFNIKNGIISSFYVHTNKMDNDKAYALSKELHEKFGISTTKFEAWMVEARQKPMSVGHFSSINNELNPRLSISFRSSFDKLIPWIIYVNIDWKDDKK